MWISPGGNGARLVSIVVVLSVASCHREPEPRPFPDAPQRAEAALRQVGHDLFDVVSFRTEGHEVQPFYDSYSRLNTSFYRLRYAAEIRCTRDLRALSAEEARARLRQPDATLAEIERATVLRRLLGAGVHREGSTQTLRNIAVFEETDTQWRFVAIDGPDLEKN